MARQPLVDVRVVGAKQIEHAPVLRDGALDEELGLGSEGLDQVVVEVGEIDRIADDVRQVVEMQPLGGEVLTNAEARDRATSPHLCAAVRGRRFLALGRVEQRSSGMLLQRKNEAVRPVRHRPAVGTAGAHPPGPLDPQQELGIDEQALERELDSGVEASALCPPAEERQEAA